MSNEVLTELTDVALRIKEAFEDKDLDSLRGLFTLDARINSAGRFYTPDEFFRRLAELMPHVEQQSLDITHIEDSRITEKASYVTYLVEVAWVNPKTWEESTQHGAMSLELIREGKTWLIRGFTYARRPDPAKGQQDDDDVRPPAGGGAPPPRFFGLDSLFSFWY